MALLECMHWLVSCHASHGPKEEREHWKALANELFVRSLKEDADMKEYSPSIHATDEEAAKAAAEEIVARKKEHCSSSASLDQVCISVQLCLMGLQAKHIDLTLALLGRLQAARL